jgi:putative ABC transport system permease protein
LLALAGGVLGILLAISIAQVLVAHAPGADAILPAGDIPLDPRVFLFVFAVSLATGIAAGLYPAIQSSRTDLTNGLKDATRSSTPSRSHGRFRNILVTTEVALSLVLLVAAGLLLRSFSHLYQVKPGVRVDHTLTMAVSLPDVSYKAPAQISAFLGQLTDHMQTVPGVVSSGIVTCAPVVGHCDDRVFFIEGHPLPAGQMMDALDRAADPGYFTAAGIPVLRGRTFTRQDGIGFDEKHPKMGSVVISESMAKTYFPHEDPIGEKIFFGVDINKQKFKGNPVPHYEVIGVVGDVLSGIDQKVTPTVYMPLLEGAWDEVYVLLHTAVDPHSVVSAAQTEIEKLNQDLAVFEVRTMEEIIGHSTSDRQFSMLLFSSFAGLAVLLAAVGLYGVLSYAVSQRKGEIGIRMALGASNSDVSRLVLREGMKPAVAGIILGVIGAAFASQILRSLLFGIAPMDPLTFTLVPPVLLAIAALACYLPAVRAARIDPTVALRAE